MKHNTQTLIALFVLSQSTTQAVVISGAGANGDDWIRPTAIIVSSNFNNDTLPEHLIQEAGTAIGGPNIDVGLSSESFGATHPAHAGGFRFGQWHSGLADRTGFVLLDLGVPVDVSAIHIWNGNQISLTNRGVQNFNVLVSNDPAAFSAATGSNNHLSWSQILFNETLPQSPGRTAIPSADFDLNGVMARYVQIDLLSHYGNNRVTGLSEIRFSGMAVPEPSSALLMVFGGLLLGVRRR